MNKLLLLLLLSPAIYAQSDITGVVPVHNFPAEKIANMIMGPVNVRGDNLLGAVVIRGAPGVVADLEQTVKQLDQHHSTGVEITAYILGASNKSQTSAPIGAQVGKDLEPVVKQLSALFSYSTYELLDSVCSYAPLPAPLYAPKAHSSSQAESLRMQAISSAIASNLRRPEARARPSP